jgi:HD-like signal output (HDOD) protein
MRHDLLAFMQRAGNPPSLPRTYYELVQVLERPYASLSQLSDLILQDQSLTARILKLANSAFYGQASEIGTMEAAIQVVGFREIHNLVLATSVIQAFARLPPELVDVPSFWSHSIACGVGSALLAEAEHESEPQRFFIGGLLHEIGRLILFLNAPHESRQILDRCREEGELSSKVEQEVVGFDHAILGAELAAFWKLPQAIIHTIAGHHAPAGSSPHVLSSVLVHCADFITSALQFGNSGELYVAPLRIPPGFERYVPTDGLDTFVDELERRCDYMLPVLLNSRHAPRPKLSSATVLAAN